MKATVRTLSLMICLPLCSLGQAQDDDLDFLFEDSSETRTSTPAEPDRDENQSSAARANADQANQTEPDSAAADKTEQAEEDSARETRDTTQAAARRSSSRLIEEVIVTAQKREENVQDVPITINAFSGEKLDAFGVNDTADLQKITPGLTYTYTYGYSVIYLRGVGTDAFLPNADPSVTTYIDGINITPSQGKQDTIGPVKRVEVLKGPQGTLFGRNSTGGAINIISEDPGDEFFAEVKAEVGNYNQQDYQLFLSGPITRWGGATLTLYDQGQDLFGRNEIFGRAGPERPDYVRGGRLKLVVDPLDNLSMTFIAAINQQFNSNSLSQENTRPAPVFTGGVEPDEPDRVWHNNYLGGNLTNNDLYGLILDWKTNFADFKFIASDNYAEATESSYDYDGTENQQAFFYSNEQYNEQRTYEFQILSNDGTPLAEHIEWVAGLYHLEGDGGFESLYLGLGAGFLNNAAGGQQLLNQVSDLADQPGLGDLSSQILNQTNDVVLGNGGILTTESDSIFAQATWFATNTIDLTLGLRYQEETRGITNSFLDYVLPQAGTPDAESGQGNPYFDAKRRDQNVRLRDFSAPDLDDETLSYRVALQYRPWANMQIFTSVARGFKSPTYNIVNFFTDPDPVERETATAYELGFKSDFPGWGLQLNSSIFYTEIDNLLTAIVALPSGGVVTFRNAGSAEIKGAEVNLIWSPFPRLNPGLAVAGGATYLDAIYTDYPNGAGFDDDTGLYFGDDSLTGDTSRDFSGNDIVRTPDVTTTVSVNQFIRGGSVGDFEIGVDYYYNSGFNTTPQNSPLYEQPAYNLWSGRLVYFYDPWGLQLTAFIENATNERHFQALLQQDFGRMVTFAPPRLYGLRLKWNFNGPS